MTKFDSTLVALMVLFCLPSYAQRTMEGRPFVGADCVWSGGIGARIHAGEYLRHSLWDVTAGMRSCSKMISTGDRLDFIDITAGASWQRRLLSLRSRALSLYGGAGAFLGCEVYDPWRTLPATVDLGFGRGAFIYGASASLSAEVFLTRRCAFVLSGALPLVFPSHAGILRWEVCAGLRHDL